MSQHPPPAPTPGEPAEYLESGQKPHAGRRWALLGATSAAVVATVAAGSWGLSQLMAAPGSAADAVPGNALAYVSLDLDPAASQKIDAIRFLQRFPALKKELDLDARDDVRRWAFETVLDSADCPDVRYADDIEPWLGDRIALAAVPDSGSTVSPLFALQVQDEQAATDGLRALARCADETVGLAFVGGYAVLMEKQADADSYATAAEAAPLSADADFRAWTDRLGEPGIVTAYVAADAPARMADLAGAVAGGQEPLLGEAPDVARLYRDFEGAAGVVRFQDGRVEAELVTRGMPGGVAPVVDGGAPPLAALPASTAAAFTVSFREGWLEDWVETFGDAFGGATSGSGDVWADLEAGTGLELPEDIETLLGDGLAVSVDGSVDPAALDTGGVPRLPVGIRINGDEEEISRVLDTLLGQVPPQASEALARNVGDGYVVLGLDAAYVDRLATDGGLGDSDAFRSVVPDADRVSGGLFVNFDAEDWSTRLAEQMPGGGADVVANVAPLDALGLTSWVDDDEVQHGLFRLSVD